MNTHQDSCNRSRRRWIGLAILVIPLGIIAFVLTGCFSLSLSRDAAALRQSILGDSHSGWEEQIEIGAGAFPLHLARLALRFFDIDPHARTALRAVRSAEVGVYEFSQAPSDFGGILASADESMTERGWERLVGVRNQRDCVAVYIPKNTRSPSNVRISILVVSGRQLVVVSGRTNLKPLMEIASEARIRP